VKTRELTDVQNACLEAVQEASRDPKRSSLISADDAVAYVEGLLGHEEVSTISRPISKSQASRALQQLCAWGLLRREPRSSRGWGQGWEVSYYALPTSGAS